ncbi:MAG: methyltransferase domain-containing protein [Gemmatimonadetes bacterium]|nr:methyltransferase domain-containing protein [Gemmatimonadota bacterium]NIO32400.1 methyltransferase domain-containing protein [Gemmatimonadota bacterium]
MATLDYLHFLADAPRVDAFRRAIEAAVEPGQLVLDLGTGIGTYAMFAARAGCRVLAVEDDPVIDVARGLAADNGLADRITFLAGRTERLEPPELADLVVFEDLAPYLYHSETAEILLDVRARWLRPGATSIPRSIRLFAAPVCCPDTYRALTPWPDDAAYGLDIQRFSSELLNRLHAAAWGPDILLGEPVEVARVEPLALDPFGLDRELRWPVWKSGTLHGIGLWMDLDLADGVLYSNAPSGRSSGWDQQLLPLVEPLEVEAGEEVSGRIITLGPSPRRPEWWSWRVTARSGRREGNTFRGTSLSSSRLRDARLDGRPRLTARGRHCRDALELMDGSRTITEIARELLARYPELGGEAEVYKLVAGELDAARAEPARQQTEAPAEVRSGK